MTVSPAGELRGGYVAKQYPAISGSLLTRQTEQLYTENRAGITTELVDRQSLVMSQSEAVPWAKRKDYLSLSLRSLPMIRKHAWTNLSCVAAHLADTRANTVAGEAIKNNV